MGIIVFIAVHFFLIVLRLWFYSTESGIITPHEREFKAIRFIREHTSGTQAGGKT